VFKPVVATSEGELLEPDYERLAETGHRQIAEDLREFVKVHALHGLEAVRLRSTGGERPEQAGAQKSVEVAKQ